MNSLTTGRCKRITAILCICFLLIQTVGCGKDLVAKRSIVAEDLTGVVHAEREDKSREVVKGEKMESGDYVTVMQDSSLTLLLDKDKHVFADKATFFRLDAVDAGTEISLLGGTLTINIENKLSDGETFEVSTPNAVMAVRGTIFTVTVTQEDGYYTTELSVREGAVEVRTIEDGKEITKMVNPGESVILEGSAPGSGYVPPAKAEDPDSLLSRTVDLSSYDDIGRAYGGMITVCKNDKWGAVDYDGKEIVPCEYDDCRDPNLKGYGVFMNTDENYQSTYYLFDNTGKLITSSPNKIVASGDAYIITDYTQYSGDEPGYYEDDLSTTYSYYRYDGSLIASFESGYSERFFDSPHGFYNGKSIITGNIRQAMYSRENIFDGFNPYNFGLVDINGNVEWFEGDGLDENDTSKYMDYAAHEAAEAAMYNNGYGGAGAGGNPTYPEMARNSAVNGYFLTQALWEEGIFLRDLNGHEIWLEPWNMTIEGDVLNYYKTEYYRDSSSEPTVVYTGNSSYSSDYWGFWHDGDWIYNYGPKILIKSNNKYAIADFSNDNNVKYTVYDYVAMSDEKYWLVSKDDKWGYCDHEGGVAQLFDDACAFSNGIALVIIDGEAYAIDDNFTTLKHMGPAESVVAGGELLAIKKDGTYTYYIR